MDIEQIKTFSLENGDSKCIKFIKRKFRCILIYMLLCISLIQLIVIIFEKIDDKYFNILIENLLTNKNLTQILE